MLSGAEGGSVFQAANVLPLLALFVCCVQTEWDLGQIKASVFVKKTEEGRLKVRNHLSAEGL